MLENTGKGTAITNAGSRANHRAVRKPLMRGARHHPKV